MIVNYNRKTFIVQATGAKSKLGWVGGLQILAVCFPVGVNTLAY